MRLRSHVPSTLKTIAVRTPLCTFRPQWHHRASAAVPLCLHRYSSTTKHAPDRIAILGGGISGLASAYFTAKEFPNAEITLFESGKETGGWIKSRRVDIPGEGNVLFELGPRTLRNATPTAMLIQELGLIDQVVYTKRSEPGAQNRFIYYPDQLNRLPASAPSLIDGFNLWRTGMLDGIMGILKEPMVPQRSQSMDDETVGSFLARRTDRRIAENIVSAVFHGIYAGDIWQLSARTLLPLAWELEGLYGSALGGFFKLQNASSAPEQLTLAHPLDLDIAEAMNREIDLDLEFAKELKASSMFTFKDGLQTLSQALKTAVETKGNVSIKTEAHIQSIDRTTDGPLGIQITSGSEANTTKSTFDLAVSTLPNADLTPHVTVMTVNLYFSSPTLLPVEGFGYLIPQSVPFEQNPERALGVIFDSSAIKGQDTAPGTKVTVMLGGHWWDTWTEYPTEEEGLEMARSILRRHLNIEDEPVAHVVNLSNKCIPQYTLGYAGRLRKFAENMKEEYKGRLRITGSQYNGVGVNDCITGAWNVARGLRGDGWKSESCGLDKAMDNRKYVVAAASELAYSRKVRSVGMDRMDGRGDGGV